jgi:hypothetical protein
MNIATLMIGLITGLFAAWGLTATYFFAPDLFAHLDVSDILSGVAMTVLAVAGNLATFRPF